MKLKPTQEQLDCIKASKEHKSLKVNAYAGASKTTTLVMIAEENPKPSLYIAFNKSIAEEARGRFPSYVECRTSHSLAYEAVGRDYAKKLKRPVGRYVNVCGTGSEIASYFGIEEIPLSKDTAITATCIGVSIKDTLTRFEQSDSQELKEYHVPISHVSRLIDCGVLDKKYWRNIVLPYAKKLWALRINKRSDILCTHDTYLKLWQLSKPDLSKYDVIYLDEAQDSNPCLLDIVLSQNTSVVMVGDKYQAIYGWRGAVNAMEDCNKREWEYRTLTKSFRYGDKIANVANNILELNEIQGTGEDTISKEEILNDCVHTRIYRTNTALIAEATKFITKGKRCCIEVDTKDLVKLLESAAALKKGKLKEVKHDDLVSYKSWGELESDAPTNLMPIINMVNKNMHYTTLGVLKDYKNDPNPEITFITAHKSKGLEWDVVVLAEDFKTPMNKDGDWKGLPDEERNLLYVAATRAKKHLVYNQAVEDYLENGI